MKLLLELFITFFKVGIMTFGGGISMLPILEREIVDEKKWATKEELLDYYAISQCTPGIIAVNIATFIGHKKKGNVGGIFSTIGVITPSVIIILLIATLLKSFSSYPIIQSAFSGIRVAVCALILSSLIGLYKKGIKDYLGFVIFLLSLFTMIIFDISPVYIVIGAIIIGILYNLRREKK